MKRVPLLFSVFLLTVSLVGVSASAAQSSGKVQFAIVSQEPPGISDRIIPGIHSTNGIDFGAITISMNDQTCSSVATARQESQKYAGVVVESYGVAGKIQLKISDFVYVDAASRAAQPIVMKGYSLTLTPGPITKPDFSPGKTNLCTATGNVFKANTTYEIFSVPDNNVGIFGVNYAGELLVPGNSVMFTGEAKAVMTWSSVIDP